MLHMSKLFTPRRQLGRTGFIATQIGIGDLADRNVPIDQCVATVHRAIDAGLNLIDTAPSYENGYSEEILGKAFSARRAVRDNLFVIDKIDHFRQSVAPQIDASLQRLGIDHTDLFVFHGCSTMDDWNYIASPGGGMDQLQDCIKSGKARFKGISSHNPDVLVAALNSGRCDVVMFPIGPYANPSYEQQVLPLTKKLGVGTVCFKTFGAGKLLGDTSGYNRPLANRPRGKVSSGGDTAASPTLPHLSVEDCLHYTLSIDPDVALLGLSFPNEQDAAFAAFKRFAPLGATELAEIRHRAVSAIQEKGDIWWNPGGK